jgi:UDP-glucose 4-epimerase
MADPAHQKLAARAWPRKTQPIAETTGEVMKVIVFGGSGFLGSHVADALSARKHQVTIFDSRPSTFLRADQKFTQGDMLDLDSVVQAVQGHEALYNFAGIADIDECLTHPIETVRVNVLGCLNQLEAARAARIRRFVFASSIYVYSESGGFYRTSKQACELYIEEYHRLHGLDYTILRYGTLYGPRADQRNSVYRYLRQAIDERRISVIGNEDALREYIHVRDAARASEEILALEFRNENVTITGHQPMRLKELLTMIQEIVGTEVQISITPPRENCQPLGHYNMTPYRFHPKIAKKLASNYYFDLGQGLLDCLEEIYGSLQAQKSSAS